MSSDAEAKSGTPNPAESGTTDDSKVTVDRPAEEYAKRLMEVSAENKKFREKNKQSQEQFDKLQSDLQALREEKAKEQGQYKQMYEELKGKYESETTDRKRDKAAFAFKTVTSQFAAEAAKAGCTKVDDLIKLATADGIISELEVSEEDFSVTQESLKSALEKAQKQYSYLYGRSTPGVRDGVPNTKPTAGAKKDLSTMKMDDLIALAKDLPN